MVFEQIRELSYEEVRKNYRLYLETLNISKTTQTTACTDAFYLWRKRGKAMFWQIVLSDDFEALCKKELTNTLASETGSNSGVSSYTSHLRRFRNFVFAAKFEKIPENNKPVKRTVSKTNKKHIPRPSVKEVETYLARWEQLENYHLQEDALNKLFFELCPQNNDIVSVLLKCSTLNDFYSTNIFSIYPVAKHILTLNIDARLRNGDVELVRDSQFIEIGGKQRNFYSFATKYCSHHNPVEYPIYDSYVDKVLRYFQRLDGFSAFTPDELKEYVKFKNALIAFRDYYGLTDFTLKQIDQYIWQLGKEYFPKKY